MGRNWTGITDMSGQTYCWCALCQNQHRAYFNKEWFVAGCPHFLMLSKLQEYNLRLDMDNPYGYNYQPYCGYSQKQYRRNKNTIKNKRNKDKLTSVLKQTQTKKNKKKKPKVYWQIDIEDISTGEL